MPGQVDHGAEKETKTAPSHHIELAETATATATETETETVTPSEQVDSLPSPGLRDSKGWDGKLRVDRNVLLQNPEAISDPEYSDEENVVRGEEISADEGTLLSFPPPCITVGREWTGLISS